MQITAPKHAVARIRFIAALTCLLLLAACVSPQPRSNTGHRQALHAIEAGDARLLDRILENDSFDRYRQPLLSLAAVREKCLACLHVLAKDGYDFSKTDAKQRTPLMLAVKLDSPDMVALLVNNPATINLRDDTQMTALMTSAYHLSGIMHGKEQARISRMLIAHGADLDARDKLGKTALTIASRRHRTRVAAVLLDAGADTTLAANKGWTPLMIAASRGYLDLVKLFAGHARSVNQKTNSGWTALMIAGNADSWGDDAKQAQIAQALLDMGADIKVRNDDGVTALFVAAGAGYMHTARVLLRAGANPAVANTFGWTPLIRAVYEGHAQMVKLLSSHAGMINARTR